MKFGVFKFATKYHNLVDCRKPYVVANINFRYKQPPRKWNWEACGLFLLSSTAWKETPRVCVWSSSNSSETLQCSHILLTSSITFTTHEVNVRYMIVSSICYSVFLFLMQRLLLPLAQAIQLLLRSKKRAYIPNNSLPFYHLGEYFYWGKFMQMRFWV